MKVAFYTLGCKLNYAESSQIQGQFEQAGHTVVRFGEDTDAIIINTCTVTENADRECRQIIRRALRISPAAFVGVTGCYAQLQPESIASIDGVDAVFGASEKFGMLNLIPHFAKLETPRIFVSELGNDIEFKEAQSSENDSRTRAFLKIQDGCNYKCSFCTIPLARGKSRSMALETVAERLRTLEAEGYHEVILSGINLGDYAASEGREFVDVLRMIDAMAPRLRVRISSIEPNLLSPEILEIVASSAVFCKHFHIPLQSGSPQVLRMMRRRYTAQYYRELVYGIKQRIPDCCIGVDVIVGFPGETDALFDETYSFLHELPVSYLHVFSYSERENTPAASYAQSVPAEARRERSRKLRNLSQKKKGEFYRSQYGSERVVIAEKRNPADGKWIGWTENYVRCEFEGSGALVQAPARVRLAGGGSDSVEAEYLGHDERLSLPAEPGAFPAYIPILS